MRPCLIALLLLAGAGTVHAGIYATTGMPPGPEVEGGAVKPMPAAWFRDNLNERLALTLEQPASDRLVKKRQELLRIVNELDSKRKAGVATLDDQINLSANLMWVGKPREAVEVLEPLARGEGRSNFMVLSNLATAYELAGQLERVPDYLQQARLAWPDEAPGMSKEQLAWYKTVDRLQFRLALLRRAELARQPAGVRFHPEGMDGLFGEPPVQYVGESGAYEAGKLAAKEQAKLPKDSLASLQQLVLWFPDDTRLLWQVGELLNAQGQVSEAYDILDDCVGAARRYDSKELKEHRRILQEARPAPPPPPPGVDLLPNRQKAVVVGGMAGILIVTFAWLQVREFRRRRAQA